MKIAARLSTQRGAIFGVLDQALSSGTNFLFTVNAARLFTPEEFGAVTLTTSAIFALRMVARATVNEVYALKYGDASPNRQREMLRAAAGTVFTVGACAALAMLAFTPALDTQRRSIVFAIAAFAPALLVCPVWM